MTECIEYIEYMRDIKYIGDILHILDLLYVQKTYLLQNELIRTKKWSGLKHRGCDGKVQYTVQNLTNTLYFLPVCAVMMHSALSRKHILKMLFLR